MKKTIKERLEIGFEGYWNITGVGIVDRYNYLIVANWHDEHPEKFETKSGENSWTALLRVDMQNERIQRKVIYGSIGRTHCDGGIINGKKEAFFSSYAGLTYHVDYANDTFSSEGDLKTYTLGARDITLIGSHFYLAYTGNQIYRRDGIHKWTDISQAPRKYSKKIEHGGTKSVSGFSEKEIYFSGRDGSLWYYDGKEWERIKGMPKNMHFHYVECCEDAKVYAIDSHGEGVAVGRYGKFEFIPIEDKSPIKGSSVYDLVTFKGKIYLTTGSDIHVLEGNKWVDANIPDTYGGIERLAAKDGIMLIATPYSLKIYDGKETYTLYGEETETERLFLQAGIQSSMELQDKGAKLIEALESIK